MSNEQSKPLKVFVSYSWTSTEHELRVLGWAERLCGDGIDVVLDKWVLKEGQDKYVFMEQMVTNPDITKVIVFSDAAYAKKADDRKGGVGTESQIISKEVYDRVDQQKFIPVVCEFTPEGKPCLPVFLAGRIYIDFSTLDRENQEWEKLLRAVFDKPLFKKPPIGKPPGHLFDDSVVASRSKGKLRAFRDALQADRASFRGLLTDFLDIFLESLEDHRVDFSKSKKTERDLVVESIDRFLPARDEFIEFVLWLSNYRADQEPHDRVIDFFEATLRYHWQPEDMTSWMDSWAENFQFFTYELFLYYIAALLKHRRYAQINSIFRRRFLYPPNAHMPPGTTAEFTIFRSEMPMLRQSTESLSYRQPDIFAQLLNRRATIKQLPFESIIQADVVLFVGYVLYGTEAWSWYPSTLAFARHSHMCELFVRATSKQGFEQIQMLFGVKSKDDFIAKLKLGLKEHEVERWVVISGSRSSLDNLLNLDRLATTA